MAPVVMFFFARKRRPYSTPARRREPPARRLPSSPPAGHLARALFLALSGQSKAQILAAVATAASRRPRNGAVTEALATALEAFAATGNFRDAVLDAANHGGNSDVAAAACGQLAGAHYGAAAIPAPWRQCLAHRDLIETYADRLLQHALLKMG